MKIGVIADDITGAAEFNGIALRYGISTLLGLSSTVEGDSDIIVLSTDSRSMNQHDAIDATISFTASLTNRKVDLFFKKTDSVLRGHVYGEIKCQLPILGKKRCLLLPANPSMGRQIIDGYYFVNGVSIEKTSFANDPDFPIVSSSVLQMLKSDNELPVYVVSSTDQHLPETGILIGNVSSEEDLFAWINRFESDMLIAGGGDLFQAILKTTFHTVEKTSSAITSPFLFVSGTTFGSSVSFIKSLVSKQGSVFYIPNEFLHDEFVDMEAWINGLSETMKNQGKAIVAFDPDMNLLDHHHPLELRRKTGIIIHHILQNIKLTELFIEGGSTAAAILQTIDATSLVPKEEIGRGVVKYFSAQHNLYITVKPGSYPLPDMIKQHFLHS